MKRRKKEENAEATSYCNREKKKSIYCVTFFGFFHICHVCNVLVSGKSCLLAFKIFSSKIYCFPSSSFSFMYLYRQLNRHLCLLLLFRNLFTAFSGACSTFFHPLIMSLLSAHVYWKTVNKSNYSKIISIKAYFFVLQSTFYVKKTSGFFLRRESLNCCLIKMVYLKV